MLFRWRAPALFDQTAHEHHKGGTDQQSAGAFDQFLFHAMALALGTFACAAHVSLPPVLPWAA